MQSIKHRVSFFMMILTFLVVSIGLEYVEEAAAAIPLKYLIRPRAPVTAEVVQDLLIRSGLTIEKNISEIDLYVTTPNDPLQFERVGLPILKESGTFLYIEKNSELHTLQAPQLAPNDPLYPQQTELNRLSIETAWNRSTGTKDIVVAVVDTGAALNHIDLVNQLWINADEIPNNGIDDDNNGFIDDVRGWNFLSRNNNVNDDNRHGTHVSGIIGAEGNNSQGTAGVNWRATIMPVKFLDAGGSGSTEDGISAVIYAANNGARLINASWGGGSASSGLSDAIRYAFNHGALFVAAAGNDSVNADINPMYPAAFDLPGIISVASSVDTGKLSSFSNYGALSVDLAAPSSDILSTLLNNTWGRLSGTSMATPMVTGVGALVLSVAPNLSAIDLRNAILNAVDDRTSYQGTLAANGDLNASRALDSLQGGFQIWPARYTIPLNGTFQYTAYRANGAVTWSVNDPGIASISATGELKGLAEGQTLVIARDSVGNIASTQWVKIIRKPTPPSNPGGGCWPFLNTQSQNPWETTGAALSMGLPIIVGLLSRRKRFR